MDILYYVLMFILYIGVAFSCIVFVCSLLVRIDKSENSVRISNGIQALGIFMLTCTLVLFIMTVLVYKTVSIDSPGRFIGLYIMNTFNIISLSFLWPFIRWSVAVKNDQIIFGNIFKRREIINIADLDLEKSRCVFLKGASSRDCGGDLYLVTKDGKLHKKKIVAFFAHGNSGLIFNTLIEAGVQTQITYVKFNSER